MAKREAELKRAFTQELKQQLPSYLVLLQATAGAPDRLIVGDNCVSAWEFKHADPNFTTDGNQVLFCRRLARQIPCFYVVYYEGKLGKTTHIIHPEKIEAWKFSDSCHTFIAGHDHKLLVRCIGSIHVQSAMRRPALEVQ